MALIIAYRPVELRLPPAGAARETAAAPFRARLKRRAPSLRARLARPARLRSAGFAGLAAVAATLGPLDWEGALIETATAQAPASALQPFETPGDSFPGSAFYFLAPDSGVIGAPGQTATTAEPQPAAPLDVALGDAVARPTFLAGTAQDRLRALQCLTTAIYYEAATEPDAGQRAVAQVVLNRVAHPAWPNSVCGVVYQGSERPGCQFSFACDGSLGRAPARMWWQRARAVAEQALEGEVYAPVGLATHYHTSAVDPAWAARLGFIGTIGAHRFYRNLGVGGGPAAFADRYFGGEPASAPLPRRFAPATAGRDPAALAPARPGAPPAVAMVPQGSVAAPAAPFALPDTLPAASGIRPEYINSGRWIAQPRG